MTNALFEEPLKRWTTEEILEEVKDVIKQLHIADVSKKVGGENTKLKELLKECKQWFDWYHIDTGTGKEYIESYHKKGHEIHQRINQVLGEE